MRIRLLRHALSGCIAAALLGGCAAPQSAIGVPGATSSVAVSTRNKHLHSAEKGPFLYVAGELISMYALGSSEPLHSTNKYGGYFIALDGRGDLCASNDNITLPQIYAFDARSLKFEGVWNGNGVGPIVANRWGYLYGTDGRVHTSAYSPGCTHRIGTIPNCRCGPLAFDRSGNLYAGEGAIRIYAPTDKTWHVKLSRAISDGIDGPGALVIAPSQELFVANSGNSSVSVFAQGGSQPIRRITNGVNTPAALAVDSTGRLYVASLPESAAGWVTVYAPGGTRPVRKIGNYPRFYPDSLALDPSGNLYVGLGTAVNVYAPGATKLLRRITRGVNGTFSLLIGSP
jgi:DNA-binding beta-propeller fold protein YncE